MEVAMEMDGGPTEVLLLLLPFFLFVGVSQLACCSCFPPAALLDRDESSVINQPIIYLCLPVHEEGFDIKL